METRATDQTARTIVVLNRDLFFGIRLNQLLKQLGFRAVLAKTQDVFLTELGAADVALGIIDINFGPDWEGIARAIEEGTKPPIIAFGPHLDVEGLRSAKKAGVTRVFSNGDFSRDTATIVSRYARPAQQSGEISE
jgi:FixJ family two-component response regulator